MLNKLTGSEKKFILWVIVFLIVITGGPYLYAYFQTPDGYEYLGLHAMTTADIPTYYAKIEQVKQGNYLPSPLYAGSTDSSSYFNPFWLMVGFLAKIFHISSMLMFQLTRLLLIPIFVFVLYKFISLIFNSTKLRKYTLLFVLFSSGLGVFFESYFKARAEEHLLYWPMDFWVPEAFTFTTLYHIPHFIASLTLIIGIFSLMYLALSQNKLKYSFLAGLCSMFLIFFHPFHALTVFIVLAVYIIILFFKYKKFQWQLAKHYLILSALSLPAILYYAWLLGYDRLTQQIAMQNTCKTPPFSVILIAYGLFLFFSIVGIYYLVKKKKIFQEKYIFLVVWSIVGFLLIFLPVNFQRRLTEGLHVPLSIATIIGLVYIHKLLTKKLNKKWLTYIVNNKLLIFILFISFFCLSNLYVLTRDVYLFNTKSQHFFLQKGKQEAITWLKNNTDDKAVVISHTYHSNLIPGWSGRRVYSGHDVETPNYKSKHKEVGWFFTGDNKDESKKRFLEKNKITHIYYSDLEKKMGVFEPGKKEYLKLVYKNDLVEIFQVNPR